VTKSKQNKIFFAQIRIGNRADAGYSEVNRWPASVVLGVAMLPVSRSIAPAHPSALRRRGAAARRFALAAAAVTCGAVSAAPVAAQLIYTQVPEPGDTFANACTQTPLHAEPDGYAEVVGTATFEQTFEVVQVTGKYLLPKSMRYSTTHGDTEDAWARQRGELEYHPRDFFPAWVEVKTDHGHAFITMRCLVSPEFAEQQTIEDAERKFEQAAIAQGGKGFNLKPASGGSGKGLAGQLAGLGDDRAAVQALLRRRTPNPQAAFKDFRAAGDLGEFAPEIDDPNLRAKPARDIERAPSGDPGEAIDDAFDKMFGN
jgi:hypothetical protein